MRIGILTGGGDCPGLNSVIYGVLLRAYESGDEVVGIEKGWKGFMENITRPLNIAELDDLHTVGGTILYTSRTNPLKEAKQIDDPEQREESIKLVVQKMIAKFKELNIDTLVAIGGDDTLGVAAALSAYGGAKVVGVPKTIDNDLSNTDYTFGFWSAVQLASNAMDNLTTTASSHQRIFVVQVMGRDAGWLTLASGISNGSDAILLPEMPFDLEKDIVEILRQRVEKGYKYHIIACAEGAVPSKESISRDFRTITQADIDNLPKDSFGNPLLAKLNISKVLVKEIEGRDDLRTHFKKYNAEFEVRDIILGHTMRAGTPNSFDRILGLRLGVKAGDLIAAGDFGKMVCLKGEVIESAPLVDGAQKKLVPVDSDWLRIAGLITKVKHKSKRSKVP